MTIDLTKPVQTRKGHKARIICTDRKHSHFPVIALVQISDDEATETYTIDGKWNIDGACDSDLINVPEEVVTFRNVYTNGAGFEYDTFEKALLIDKQGSFIATLKITKIDGKIIKKEIMA
jgi:hypothetical protein